ncbi:hypothetical protein M758_7G169300, partial [Ceratodon purpureus]
MKPPNNRPLHNLKPTPSTLQSTHPHHQNQEPKPPPRSNTPNSPTHNHHPHIPASRIHPPLSHPQSSPNLTINSSSPKTHSKPTKKHIFFNMHQKYNPHLCLPESDLNRTEKFAPIST